MSVLLSVLRIQGGKLAGDAGAGEILLLDVTPLTLSIETMGGIATQPYREKYNNPYKEEPDLLNSSRIIRDAVRYQRSTG